MYDATAPQNDDDDDATITEWGENFIRNGGAVATANNVGYMHDFYQQTLRNSLYYILFMNIISKYWKTLCTNID